MYTVGEDFMAIGCQVEYHCRSFSTISICCIDTTAPQLLAIHFFNIFSWNSTASVERKRKTVVKSSSAKRSFDNQPIRQSAQFQEFLGTTSTIPTRPAKQDYAEALTGSFQ